MQLPGFLELIVEFYRRCLIQMFGILQEYEIGAEGPKATPKDPGEAPSPLNKEDAKPEDSPQQSSKYDKWPVRVEEAGESWAEVERRADPTRPNGFISGLLHWKAGGGDSTAHIQTHFEPRSGDFRPPDPEQEKQSEGVEEQRTEEEEQKQTGHQGGKRINMRLCSDWSSCTAWKVQLSYYKYKNPNMSGFLHSLEFHFSIITFLHVFLSCLPSCSSLMIQHLKGVFCIIAKISMSTVKDFATLISCSWLLLFLLCRFSI